MTPTAHSLPTLAPASGAPSRRYSALVDAAHLLGLPAADIGAYSAWRASKGAESSVLPAEARRVRGAS